MKYNLYRIFIIKIVFIQHISFSYGRVNTMKKVKKLGKNSGKTREYCSISGVDGWKGGKCHHNHSHHHYSSYCYCIVAEI